MFIIKLVKICAGASFFKTGTSSLREWTHVYVHRKGFCVDVRARPPDSIEITILTVGCSGFWNIVVWILFSIIPIVPQYYPI